MRTPINPLLTAAIHASIERTKANTDKSPIAKPYVPKKAPACKIDTSALAISLERGKELVANRGEVYCYIAGEQCIYNVQEVAA